MERLIFIASLFFGFSQLTVGQNYAEEPSEAYFDKQEDKQQAIADILNIEDAQDFLHKSGYLDEFLRK